MHTIFKHGWLMSDWKGLASLDDLIDAQASLQDPEGQKEFVRFVLEEIEFQLQFLQVQSNSSSPAEE